MEDKVKNPFANEDGSPIDGQEKDFFDWEIEHSRQELEKLPEEKQIEILESEHALNKRMDS